MDWHKQSRRCVLVAACLPPELALAKLQGQNCWGKAGISPGHLL